MKRIFENKVALISGGLGDIGKAISMAFAREGASVAMCGTREPKLAEQFLEELGKNSSNCSYHQVDVSNVNDVSNWIKKVEKETGVPDFVIPNAARATQAGISEISAEDWAKELEVNLNGSFFMAQIASSLMLQKNKPGHVVFIGSWAAHSPHSHIPAYSVSKAGLRMLCKCMALDFAQYNILVNEVAPGFVDAGLSKQVWNKNPGMITESKKKVPNHKIIHPDEVAWQVLQLCHPKNKNITGSTILIDGGLSLLS